MEKGTTAEKPPECRIWVDRNWMVIRPRGYLNDEGGAEMQRMMKLQVLEGIEVVLFDFTDTLHVNSVGIGAILDICDSILDFREIPIAFCRLSPLTRDAFTLAGLSSIGDFFADEGEARARLKR